MPGRLGNQETLAQHAEFGLLYPVRFGEPMGGVSVKHPAQLQLSSRGGESLLMRLTMNTQENLSLWTSLPGFHWYQPSDGLKAGATALAFHEQARNAHGPVPLVVTARAGRGKVLYMGIDSSWRWRRGVEDRYHYRFWRQMARWMAYQRNLTQGEQATLFLSRDRLSVGQDVRLNLQAMTSDGQPVTADQLQVRMTLPSGEQRLIPLVSMREWGEFAGRLTPEEAGEYRLAVLVDGDEVAQRVLQVQAIQREGLGAPADPTALNAISRVSGGNAYRLGEEGDLWEQLSMSLTPPPRYEFVALIHQWHWYAGIAAALLLSWWACRQTGVV